VQAQSLIETLMAQAKTEAAAVGTSGKGRFGEEGEEEEAGLSVVEGPAPPQVCARVCAPLAALLAIAPISKWWQAHVYVGMCVHACVHACVHPCLHYLCCQAPR